MDSHDIETLTFAAGETLIAPGSAPDDAFVVLSGSVCVEDAADAPPLIVGPGEVVGDLDLLLGQPHSAAVVALEPVAAVRLTRLHLASALQGAHAGSTLQMRDALTGLARRLTERHAVRPQPARPATGSFRDATANSFWTALDFRAEGGVLARQVGHQRLAPSDLPFTIGRKPGRRESAPDRPVDFVIADEKPYNLSRRHFAFDVQDGAPIVRDTGSLLGTLVNGERIGAGRPSNVAPLQAGDNRIVAGAADSPIRFVVTIDVG